MFWSESIDVQIEKLRTVIYYEYIINKIKINQCVGNEKHVAAGTAAGAPADALAGVQHSQYYAQQQAR